MNHLNSILLEGVVIRTPELVSGKTKDSVSKLVKFVIANDRYYLDKNEKMQKDTLFISVLAWNRLGELCLTYLDKGSVVRCVGKLKQSKWENDKGEARSAIEIVADHVEFKKNKKGGKEEGEIKADKFLSDDELEMDGSVEESVVLYHY